MSNCASEADEDEVALWEKENHVIYTYTTGPNINLKVTVPEEYGHLLGSVHRGCSVCQQLEHRQRSFQGHRQKRLSGCCF